MDRACFQIILCVLAVFVPGVDLSARERNIRFDHLSLEDGLSQSAVNEVFQDRLGFIWLGTEDGLNLYDGHGITVFRHDTEDPGSLSNNFIWDIDEDQRGHLWVGTDSGGLDRWNRTDGSFTHFSHDPADPTSLSNDHVRALVVDSSGHLWVGTDNGGVNRLDRNGKTFTHYMHDPADPTSLSHDRIRVLYEDAQGIMWIGTYGGGLNRLDPKTGQSTHYRHDPRDRDSLSDDMIRSISEDRDGRLWIGTYRGGLNLFDPQTEYFTHYAHDPSDPHSLEAGRIRSIEQDQDGTMWVGTGSGLCEWRTESNDFICYTHDPTNPGSLNDNRVTTLFTDRGSVLWVGTKGGGINKWNTVSGNFLHYDNDPTSPVSLNHRVVTSIREDDGILWVGTFGGGLNRIDRTRQRVRYLKSDPGDPASLNDNRVMSLLLDSRGYLWAGTYEGGLNRMDPDTGRFVHFMNDPADAHSLSRNGVMALYEDRMGAIWVGTHEGGLNRFDRKTATFVRYQHDADDPSSLSNDLVTSFCEDSTGVLWIGTDGGGLNRFDRSTGNFTHYRSDPDDPRSLNSDAILSIHEDERGTLWIGTKGGGVNRWELEDRNRRRAVFKHYTVRAGLPNDHVYGILSDRLGSLWFSTKQGLSRFDPSEEAFTNYDTLDGLQSNEFNFGAYCEGQNGELLFGGINGFNAFHPERISKNLHVPPVVLTSILKFNETFMPDESIASMNVITLSYDDYVVSFEFAALDYTAPDKNNYAYKLEGFDEDWNAVGNMRRATYTNLAAGEYTFRVKAANNDGIWNSEGAALAVTVLPPPWQTWWAYSIYVLLLGGVVLSYTRVQAQKLKSEADYSHTLAEQVRERTRKLGTKNDQLKQANLKLEEASLTDSLTGLRNRRYLMTQIDEDIVAIERDNAVLERRRPTGQADFLFLMIDLDGLKTINDTYGHMAGDMALLQLRDLLLCVCRKSDTIIRWGGDEFLVVGRGMSQEDAECLAERIRAMVANERFSVAVGKEVGLSCSVGFARYPFMPQSPSNIKWEQVLTIADKALYAAKHSGRNAWVAIMSTDQTPKDNLLQHMHDDLEEMVREGQLEVCSSVSDEQRLTWQQ